VAVHGIAGEGDPAAAASAAASQVLVAPPCAACCAGSCPRRRGAAVHVVENPPVFEALVDGGLPADAALACTATFPSAAAVRYSGDLDGNGLQIALRVLGLGRGEWTPWRMESEDFLASATVARGRALRERDERRALEGRAAGARGTAPRAAPAAAIPEAGAVAFQGSLAGALREDGRAAQRGAGVRVEGGRAGR